MKTNAPIQEPERRRGQWPGMAIAVSLILGATSIASFVAAMVERYGFDNYYERIEASRNQVSINSRDLQSLQIIVEGNQREIKSKLEALTDIMITVSSKIDRHIEGW